VASYVLDTHACVIALAAPKKLGPRARRALEAAEKRGEAIWVPAAAATEVVMLKELGRTAVGAPALRAAFDTGTWKFLPLDWNQVDIFATLASVRDPFDRLIVAAARATASKIVSRDAELEELGMVDVVWK
jgi:PIN domain nuclease of toxin-antitoxin system